MFHDIRPLPPIPLVSSITHFLILLLTFWASRLRKDDNRNREGAAS